MKIDFLLDVIYYMSVFSISYQDLDGFTLKVQLILLKVLKFDTHIRQLWNVAIHMRHYLMLLLRRQKMSIAHLY